MHSHRDLVVRDRRVVHSLEPEDVLGGSAVLVLNDGGDRLHGSGHRLTRLEEILDGIIDVVFSEIELPPADAGWRSALRHRALSARSVLARHPWATPPMESPTTPGPPTLRQHDVVIGTLRRAGFSIQVTAHAYSLLASYVNGFAPQEASLPFTDPDTVPEIAEAILAQFRFEEYPHLAEQATEHILQPGHDRGHEFEFGLDRIL